MQTWALFHLGIEVEQTHFLQSGDFVCSICTFSASVGGEIFFKIIIYGKIQKSVNLRLECNGLRVTFESTHIF